MYLHKKRNQKLIRLYQGTQLLKLLTNNREFNFANFYQENLTDVSKVKESSFLKLELTDPPQIFDAHLLENTNFSPSSFHFSVAFYITIMF